MIFASFTRSKMTSRQHARAEVLCILWRPCLLIWIVKVTLQFRYPIKQMVIVSPICLFLVLLLLHLSFGSPAFRAAFQHVGPNSMGSYKLTNIRIRQKSWFIFSKETYYWSESSPETQQGFLGPCQSSDSAPWQASHSCPSPTHQPRLWMAYRPQTWRRWQSTSEEAYEGRAMKGGIL